MCEFISWVKKDKELYYLTDAEVFSEFGKEKFAGCLDNDFLGHGAIRKYYGLGGSGTDHEQRDFWKSSKLPKELADKVKQFNKHWGRVFKKFLQDDDLRYIIRYASAAWKGKAAAQLLKQKPTNDDLCYIIAYAPAAWKGKAAAQLLKQKPTNLGLCYIIAYAPAAWKGKAAAQLLKQKPTTDDLCYIIERAPAAWAVKAQKLLDSRK